MEEFLNEIIGNEILVSYEVDDGVITQFAATIDNVSKDGLVLFGTNSCFIKLNSLCNFTRTPSSWIVETANNKQFFISITRQN